MSNRQFSCIILIYALLVGDQIVKRQREASACILPEHPLNGIWSVVTGTNSPYTSPGFEVPAGTALNIQCQPGYPLQGVSFIICTGETWSAEIAKCQTHCPPITSTVTTKVTCINPNDRKSAVENCTNAVDRTIAKFTCAQFYESVEINRNPLLVCQNGSWSDPIPTCRPICGVKSVSAKPLIIGGSIPKTTDYPWHVGIYSTETKSSEQYAYLCGASLINERVMITVAHCLTNINGLPRPTGVLRAGAGKFYRTPHDPRDIGEQFTKIQHVFTADGYNPQSTDPKHFNFFADVGILVSEKPFVLSKYVMPICIDWSLNYENLFTGGKVKGMVVGWGFTTAGQKVLADELRELHVPYTPYDVCSNSLPPKYDHLFTNDKLCAGYFNQSKSLCSGDAGGGLVFRSTDGRYYLVGLVSGGPSAQGFCDIQQNTLYTKISSYTTNFIFEKERQFRPESQITRFQAETSHASDPLVVITKSEQLCGLKSTKSQILIVNGRDTEKGDYPWQIAIYETTKQYQLICGGSLIHHRIVLTAAHCVTDLATNKVESKEHYMLAAGKYFRNYDDPRDSHVQYSSIQEIFIPPQYEGDNQNYMADIAILISKEAFVLSKFVQPVCIDWDNKYENKLANSQTKGFVAGWGSTRESGEFEEALKDLEVPYIDRHQCKRELPNDYDIYLTFDKICSGYLNKSKSVCTGDSGGGLVFRIPEANRYYIAGIVSLAPRSPTSHGGCDSEQYTLYTRVSHYITSFIISKVRQYL